MKNKISEDIKKLRASAYCTCLVFLLLLLVSWGYVFKQENDQHNNSIEKKFTSYEEKIKSNIEQKENTVLSFKYTLEELNVTKFAPADLIKKNITIEKAESAGYAFFPFLLKEETSKNQKSDLDAFSSIIFFLYGVEEHRFKYIQNMYLLDINSNDVIFFPFYIKQGKKIIKNNNEQKKLTQWLSRTYKLNKNASHFIDHPKSVLVFPPDIGINGLSKVTMMTVIHSKNGVDAYLVIDFSADSIWHGINLNNGVLYLTSPKTQFIHSKISSFTPESPPPSSTLMFSDFVKKIDSYLNKKLRGHYIESILRPYGWNLKYTSELDLIKHGIEAGMHWLLFVYLLITIILSFLVLLIEKKVFTPGQVSIHLLEDSLNLNDKLFKIAPIGLYLFEKKSKKELKSNSSARDFLKYVTESEKTLFLEEISNELNANPSKIYAGEKNFQTSPYKEVTLEVKAIEVKENNYTAIFCVLRDISESVKQQKELNALAIKADASNKAKSLFLATISHEIRTPLGSIINGLELLSYSTLTNTQKNQLNLVSQSSQMLYTLINDILDFSKLEAGSISAKNEPCDARDIVEKCVQRLLHMAKKKELDIFCFIDPHFPLNVTIDKIRFEQIIHNLLSNAIKFTEKGRISVFLKFHIESKNRGIILLKINDTGIGIAPQEKVKLFQPFTQIDNELQNYHPGTGLGLSICSKLTELLHGKIMMVSEVGLGTSVSVSIPTKMQIQEVEKKLQGISVGLLLSNDIEFQNYIKKLLEYFGAFSILIKSEEITNDLDVILCDEKIQYETSQVDVVLSQSAFLQPDWNESPIYVSTFSREDIIQSIRVAAGLDVLESSSGLEKDLSKISQSLKVLVVEDHGISQKIIKQQLELLNQKVFVVSNGKEAFSLLSQKKFDLILTDIHMPIMNGFELSMLAQSLESAPRVYGMTADLNEEVQSKAKEAGMSSCFSKPLNLDQLADILKIVSENMALPTKSGNQNIVFDENTSAVLKEDILFLDATLSENDLNCFVTRLHSLAGALSLMGAPVIAMQADKLLKKLQKSSSFFEREDWDSLKKSINKLIEDKENF